jgi:hypothetical protein
MSWMTDASNAFHDKVISLQDPILRPRDIRTKLCTFEAFAIHRIFATLFLDLETTMGRIGVVMYINNYQCSLAFPVPPPLLLIAGLH